MLTNVLRDDFDGGKCLIKMEIVSSSIVKILMTFFS